jgi:hypothetical protein
VDAPTGRSQHVLYVVPADPDSAPIFIDPALAHDGPTLVLTRDAESALALAHVIIAAHPDVSVVAATTTARARRVVRNATVVVGSPTAVLGLVRATALKLDTIKTLVLAWANLEDPDLEALMAEIPKESPRVLAVESMTPAAEAFVERYARRPRRVEPAQPEAVAPAVVPAAVQYVTTSAAARPLALGRLLDELDPPSALIHVRRDASERAVRTTLHALGYHGDDAVVRVTRSDRESAEAAQLVVLYDVPLTAAELQAAVAGSAVNVVALAEPRELPRLRALATATPLTLSGPAARARSRETAMRDELRAALATGLAAREILALEPLLTEFDGIELAAAALHLLTQARATVVPTPVAPTVAPPPGPRRDDRPRDDRPRDERPRRSFGDRPRGDRARNDRPRSDRPQNDRPQSDRPHSDRPRPDRDRPHSDRPRSDRPRDPSARPPRNEWTDRGERLTHARRPPPRRPDK